MSEKKSTLIGRPVIDVENACAALDALTPQLVSRIGVELRLRAVGMKIKPGILGYIDNMSDKAKKGIPIFKIALAVLSLGVCGTLGIPAYKDYAIRARVNELILAGSAYRTPISEKFQTDRDPANAGVGIALSGTIRIPGEVAKDGTIRLVGYESGPPGTEQVGADVTIIISPSFNTSNGDVSWSCSGRPLTYMPASCP